MNLQFSNTVYIIANLIIYGLFTEFKYPRFNLRFYLQLYQIKLFNFMWVLIVYLYCIFTFDAF